MMVVGIALVAVGVWLTARSVAQRRFRSRLDQVALPLAAIALLGAGMAALVGNQALTAALTLGALLLLMVNQLTLPAA